MFGIGTKPARLLAVAALAIGVGVAGLPATTEAGDGHRRHGGHKFHGHGKHHGGHKFHGHHKHHSFKHGHRHRHHGRHFHGPRRHSHSSFAVHIWRPYPIVPPARHHWVTRACHPVVGHGFDTFGRRAKFGGTMCYDNFGNGYVVAGSQHVIHYF